MTALEEERIAAVAREDLTLLLKEYARAGANPYEEKPRD
jgi:hypothetical protein